jgi:hypothetical protein
MLTKAELAKLVSLEKDTINWKTPTSIFIGLSALKLTDECSEDEKSKHGTVKVFNPTEHRYQDEKLRIGKVLGVVLRGSNIYGWAMQDYKLKKKVGEYSFEPKESNIILAMDKSKSILPELQQLSVALLNNIDKNTRVKPMFSSAHISQLEKLTKNQEDRVLLALNRVFHNAKGVDKFSIICRMYGGGRERKAITFKNLYEKYKISEVPEQWGDGISVYSKETENMLIGTETGFDGRLYYFRLHQKDIPKYK